MGDHFPDITLKSLQFGFLHRWVMAEPPVAPRNPRKFQDRLLTATGEKRAQVVLHSLDTLWFNTGTLCNLTCRHCYIESSPKNDRLVYLTADEVAGYLDEIAAVGLRHR